MIELACPIICRFILKSENVGQTISDPGRKLIVYTLPSIWQYPFFQNDIQIPVFCQNRGIQKIGFFCIVLPIGIAYWPLLFRCGITARVIPVWPWGPWGPAWGWGKLPTVRQSYLLSGMHPTTAYMHPTEP